MTEFPLWSQVAVEHWFSPTNAVGAPPAELCVALTGSDWNPNSWSYQY